ncbi:MAG: hypothetical protein R3B45_10375 [Bdellovibrionota bacterium]
MWWLPIVTALVLALIIVFLHSLQNGREIRSTHTYRSRYLQIIGQLEGITQRILPMREDIAFVSDQKVLEYFESTLKAFELVLKAMQSVSPFGSDPTDLNSVGFLTRDCEQRIGRTQKAIADSVKGRSVDLDKMYGRKKAIERGCYFCSRPTVNDKFSRVRVKLDGVSREVLSCNVCKKELKNSKKVKVLHLQKDGKTVHWSECDDYVPSEHYWNINKQEDKQVRKLELVVSNIETRKPTKLEDSDS